MDYQDKISSYIENDLSAEAEQEFLISLAASEGLRRAFRSELIMKNIMREDERVTAPPRKIRADVFAAVGLASAVAESDVADLARTANTGFILTKLNALVGAVAIVASMGVGYVAHGLVEPSTPVVPSVRTEQLAQPQQHTVPTQVAPSESAPNQMSQREMLDAKSTVTQPIHPEKHLKQSNATHDAQLGTPSQLGTATQTSTSPTTTMPSDVNVKPEVTKPAK
jgi:hypothetical protein